jgi:hypothetical protein
VHAHVDRQILRIVDIRRQLVDLGHATLRMKIDFAGFAVEKRASCHPSRIGEQESLRQRRIAHGHHAPPSFSAVGRYLNADGLARLVDRRPWSF